MNDCYSCWKSSGVLPVVTIIYHRIQKFIWYDLSPLSVEEQQNCHLLLTPITTNTNHTTLLPQNNHDQHHPHKTCRTTNPTTVPNKHLHWYHPTLTCGLYYSIVISVSFLLHDAIVPYFIHHHHHHHHRDVIQTIPSPTDSTTMICSIDNTNDIFNNNNNNNNNEPTDTLTALSIDQVTFTTSPNNNHYHHNINGFWLGVWFLSYGIWILIWRLFYRFETPIHSSDTEQISKHTASQPPPPTHPQRIVLQSPQYPYIVLYEYCWLCNVTLMIAGIAFLLPHDRSSMILAYLIVIGMDQLLWYIDLLIYVVMGHCPIGVAKYVFTSSDIITTDTSTSKVSQLQNTNQNTKHMNIKHRQQQHWSNRITWTHHLWTIPLVLYGCQYQIHFVSYILSILYLFLNVCLSHYFIPSHIVIPIPSSSSSSSNTAITTSPTTDSQEASSSTSTSDITATNNEMRNPYRHELYYLNINLAYEVYKDVQHIPFLRIPTTKYWYQYMLALFWRWQCFNTIVYMVYCYFCKHNRI